jgi:hypothetical protein
LELLLWEDFDLPLRLLDFDLDDDLPERREPVSSAESSEKESSSRKILLLLRMRRTTTRPTKADITYVLTFELDDAVTPPTEPQSSSYAPYPPLVPYELVPYLPLLL